MKVPRSPSPVRLEPRRSVSRGRSPRSFQKSPPPPARRLSHSRSRSWSAKRVRSQSRSVTPRQRHTLPPRQAQVRPRSRSPPSAREYTKRPVTRSRSRSPNQRPQRRPPSPDGQPPRSPVRLPLSPTTRYSRKESPRLRLPRDLDSPNITEQYGRHLPSHPFPAGATGLPAYLQDKLRPNYGPVPGFSDMDPRWNDYMRSVTEWYERMGYPGFNPFLSQAHSRSPPRRLPKRSRSRSADLNRKRKRSISPAHDRRRSRSREFRGKGRERSYRSRSRDSGSRHFEFADKEKRSLKQVSKNHSSKQDPKLDSRAAKSNREETVKSKDSKVTQASSKDKVLKKGWHSASRVGDDVRKLHVSKDHASKHSETNSEQRSHLQVQTDKTAVAGKMAEKITPLLVDKPAEQPKKVVPSLMDIHFSKPVPQQEIIKVDQKYITTNSEQRRMRVETDKTVVMHKTAEKIIPHTPPIIPLEHEKEKVQKPPALLAPPPVQEVDIKKPSTAEAELVTDNKVEVLPPTSEEHQEITSSVPESVELVQKEPVTMSVDSEQLEQTAVRHVAAEKTEALAKNVAQVKPLLVASVPEMSRWERETDVSDSRDSPMYSSRGRDRPNIAKTSLPRLECSGVLLARGGC